jgi:hypothetical protein
VPGGPPPYAIPPMGTHLHTCTLCEAMCGLDITAPPDLVADVPRLGARLGHAVSGNAAVNGIPVEVSPL